MPEGKATSDPYTRPRPGSQLCPTSAGEHADISTGVIDADDDWTLALFRTERGEEWMKGVIEDRPDETDFVAMNLLNKLYPVSRKRWSGDTRPAPPDAARTPSLLAPLTWSRGRSA